MSNRYIHIFQFTIYFVFILLFTFGCSSKKDPLSSLSEYYTIKKVDLKDLVNQIGTIAPIIKVELKSEASGKIEKILVKEGQKISKGDTILIIDPYRLMNQKDKLELALRKAELNVKIAQRDYNNAIELFSVGSVAAKKLQDLELAKDVADIDYKQQKLELQDIDDQLKKTVICSPLDGVITSLLVKEGEIAVSATTGYQSGTSIGTIADISHLEVISNIGEVDYIHLKVGQKVTIKPGTEESQTNGLISFISLSAKKEGNSELSRFEIRTTIDSLIPGIAPGINVNVDFVILEKNQVVGIPYHFVNKNGSESFVSVVSKDTKGKESINQKKIKTGLTDYKFYEVLSGLSEGDIVYYKPETNKNAAGSKKAN